LVIISSINSTIIVIGDWIMANVEKRRLGKTNIEVTSIGLGAMQFSGGKGMTRLFLSAVPPDTMNEIVQVALNSGMNWIDTAEAYGSGASERTVSVALRAAGKSPGDVVITTKWLPLFKRAKSISKSAKKSTDRLKPYPIDLYLVHRPYSISSIKAQMNAMADLVESNKVRAVGVSNFSAKKMITAHEVLSDRGIPLAANQMRFNIIDRKIESNGVLEVAKELGVTIIAYTPLGQGLLSGKFHQNPELLKDMSRVRRRMLSRNLKKTKIIVDTLESIALENDVNAAQVSLNWAINIHGETIVAIPGVTKPIQAEQNAKAMDFKLSSEAMKTIDELSMNV